VGADHPAGRGEQGKAVEEIGGESMKIMIVKAIIRWLVRRHFYLLMEAVIPDGKHLHKNPPKGRRKLPMEKVMEGEG